MTDADRPEAAAGDHAPYADADAAARTVRRREWMGLLARAPVDRLKALWAPFEPAPAFGWLRAPEIGGVMVRGRAGASGAPFNLGEMTVTRAAVRLECGAVGHAHVQGRDRDKARIAALVDALMQTSRSGEVEAALLAPLAAEETDRRRARAARAAATKVDFLTLMRGEDA
ncbi:phosphonate C-P lyase system protein PhnG [Rubrimonas cliftonensis]|uniref:Alpha-D-ribose 1-methylphosphonate 5-triphosphate synthase subunit PhnG n=1 Tax=Rubrimonas cliftonensis TaxID=89524 RepID=A0A1H3YSJ0_9RHOB|nr:phosphonate C-P lyase system protein PhnG [Rubrimonas cliftonensis]SEA14141.1 alpha-D-ribose 1-methylphosphonate 5-triphosphate synthase subunit PhnG [Rubrimonas cliftonensis]